MRILDALQPNSFSAQPVSAAIGFFDGVHRGHQQVIQRALEEAQRLMGASVVITFDRHPSTIVAPQRIPHLIYPLEKKLRVIGEMGVDNVLLLHFDQALSEQSGELFLRNLARDIGLRCMAVGSNFHFGHQRSGNVALMHKIGHSLGFSTFDLPPVKSQEVIISSTRIRTAIASGDFATASAMMGRPYNLCGPVVKGDQIGGQLGFPTANLEASGLAVPPPGVYLVQASVNGIFHPAVTNIGHRPTVRAGSPLRVETHLLNLSENLYGQNLEVQFLNKLRDERKFPSLAALRQQIASDVQSAREFFQKNGRV